MEDSEGHPTPMLMLFDAGSRSIPEEKGHSSLGCSVLLICLCLCAELFATAVFDRPARIPWQTARGVVREVSDQRPGVKSGRGILYVRYSFEVNGAEYIGNRLQPEGRPPSAPAKEFLQTLRPGTEVGVYFDPANPRTSVLRLDTPGWYPSPAARRILLLGGSFLALLATRLFGRT